MFVYVMKLKEFNYYKIGITLNVQRRFNELQTGSPFTIQLIYSFNHKYARDVELILHTYLEKYNIRGEWFDISDRTFLVEILNWLKENQTYDNAYNVYLTLCSMRNRNEFAKGKKLPNTKHLRNYSLLNKR